MKIHDTAFGPVRSFMAEYAAASWRQACGGEPVLFGGRRRGHDIEDGAMLIDAKVLVPTSEPERRTWPGYDWKVFRKHHALFDPGKTTHIALVAFPRETPLRISDDAGRVAITASLGPELGQISAYLFGHATAAVFMIRPCACRCRDTTDQAAD